MSAVLTVCNYCVTRSWPLISTDQHNSNELLLAREDVALFLHTLTDGSGYEANTLDQTELHSQVLYWENAEMTVHKIKTNDAQRHKKKQQKKTKRENDSDQEAVSVIKNEQDALQTCFSRHNSKQSIVKINNKIHIIINQSAN